MEDIDPIKHSNNLILLIIFLFCIVSNFIILTVRQDSETVYQLVRQIELFTLAVGTETIGSEEEPEVFRRTPEGLSDLRVSNIETRENLFEYIHLDLPVNLFFTEENAKAFAEKED